MRPVLRITGGITEGAARSAACILISAALAAAAAGCGGADGGGAGSALSAQPTPPTAAAGTSQPAGGTAAPGSGAPGEAEPGGEKPLTAPETAPAAATVCRTGDLAGSIEGTEGAAGHIYELLVLTNRGTGPCLLQGFPGLSFLDAEGRQIGAAADRSGEPGPAVTLDPGERAGATLAITQPGLLPGCDQSGQTTPAARLRVYPPDNREALTVPVPEGREICSDPAAHQFTTTTFREL